MVLTVSEQNHFWLLNFLLNQKFDLSEKAYKLYITGGESAE